MSERELGSTGLSIHPLVYGTLPMGPLQAGLTPEEGGRLLRHALESGVNMIDTAMMYGTFEHIKKGLEGFSGEAIVATKTHALDGETAREHVEAALTGMGLEAVDIVHIHGARLADPLVEREDVLEDLVRMKEEGKLRFVGMSSHFVSAFENVGSCEEVSVIHPLINKKGLGVRGGSVEEMASAISAAADAGKGVYAMKALAGGNLISEARESFRWVLEREGVHGLAVGMLSVDEIDANIKLIEENAADEGIWKVLESRRRRFKVMENFCRGCGACVEECHSEALSIVKGVAKVDPEKCILCGYCGTACPDFIIRVI